MMRYNKLILTILLVFLLASCGDTGPVNNFDARQDNTLISDDKTIIIDYKTNKDGKMIEINIDRLLTIEQMVLLNPNIDYDYELEGFTGDIFIKPNNICTDFSNDVLIPVNIEVGNTRYKYDDDDCTYKTIDNYNDFKPGFSDEYELTDTIPVSKRVTISIIVYNPSELVTFVEIYQLPNSYEGLGVYSIMFNQDSDGFDSDLINYYKDMAIYEQLYIKHQTNEGATNEVLGITEEINLMDINNLAEIIPLIDNFEDIYESEIAAIEEMQLEIGTVFDTGSNSSDDETTQEE